MKKLLSSLLLLSNLAFSQGQPWCQPGATWHYSAGGLGGYGYVALAQSGIIQFGINNCDTYTASLTISPPFLNYVFFTNITYYENNCVYAYSNDYNRFYKLYDFGAQVGDSWYILPDYISTGCIEDSSMIEVDSISTMIISNDTLKKFHISYNNHSSVMPGWFIGYSYTEKLGGEAYLFPQPFNCLADGINAYAIRCYSDSSNWSYQSGIAFTCDDLLEVKNNVQSENYKVVVYPNPAQNHFNIQIQSKFEWKVLNIYNAQGKVVLTKIKSLIDPEILINEDFDKGVYLIKVNGGEQILYSKFIVD